MDLGKADFKTHHIEGIAREGHTPFECPLVTPVIGHLWQGGCRDGVKLGGHFKHIISLYPWERFDPERDLDTFIELRLFDGPVVPNETQLHALADIINICRADGPTLVHCQAGLNRSGLVTALALIKSGMSAEQAITLLRENRSPAVLCNKKFENWLRGL